MTNSAWTPSDDPNPSEILHSAVDDTRDGSHKQALAKFLWFHQNALHYDRALYGVRLSFALSDWLDLAAVYPPARDSFIFTRNQTEAAYRLDPSNFDLFTDVAVLNDHLGDGNRTADFFSHVAESDHRAAQRLYHVAEPYLIAAGLFQTCEPFLNSDWRMSIAAESYRLSRKFEESRPECDIPIPRFAREHYVQDIATLVALLVLNNRVEDANTAYNAALRVLNDDEFRTIMDAAMTGHLPDYRSR
jgi:hypothetical protein